MRKLLVLLGAIACASSALAQSAADPNEGSNLTHDAFNDVFTLSWWGRPGNTYFIQQSDDLLTWEYVPIIESGAGEPIEWGFTSSADKFFVRLRHTDEPAADPALADFDRDGVGNMDELLQGTDPFRHADEDGDGLPDDWETFHDGEFAAYPPSLSASLTRAQTQTASIVLNNSTAQAVAYSVALQNNQMPGYSFLDSKTGGVPFVWDEIRTTGTRLAVVSTGDDVSERVSFNTFRFPFYGQVYSQVYVSSNGYLNFGNQIDTWSNVPLPSALAPALLVAPLWSDLYPPSVAVSITRRSQAASLSSFSKSTGPLPAIPSRSFSSPTARSNSVI